MKCPKCHSDNPDNTRFCGECGIKLIYTKEISPSRTDTLQTPIKELTRGTTFAKRYEFIEELGKGGMGRVYKVYDKKIKEEVALKLLKPEISADEKTIERFSNELKFARKIIHKNVGRMYDLNEEEGIHYIIMEYVRGEDLKRLIRKVGQLSTGKAISIAKQVCEGLAEAHGLGVVHRDLKPQNIIVDEDGNARIMDFGIARTIKGKGITGSGVMIGTPEYMSPEQVDGKEADKRSDIYSLGIILYEMLTGRVPFEGDSSLTIAIKQKMETPKDPREFNAQIPEDLSRMIIKCMKKDKGKRFQGAEELLSELDKIDKGIPIAERVLPRRKPLTSKEITVSFSLKKLFVPALVSLVVIIAGLIIWQPWSQRGIVPIPTDKSSLAILYFKNNTGDESLDHWRRALSDLLINDLAQSKYIYVLPEDRLFNILTELKLLEAEDYSTKDLKEVAVRGSVENVLIGNFVKAGDNFRINASIKKVSTEEDMRLEGVEGEGEENIFAMVDELTRRIKVNFKLSEEEIAEDIDMAVGKITTSSPEALKYYIEGKKLYNEKKFREGIEVLKKAVSIDPKFAMAYKVIAVAYAYEGYPDEVKEYIQKAMELLDHVSERERYLIQASYFNMFENSIPKAIEFYQKLLSIYPEDEEGNVLLGAMYRNLEEWDLAIEQFEKVLEIHKRLEVAYENLVYIFLAKGWYDKAMETLQNNQDVFYNQVLFHRYMANILLCQGKYDLALLEAEKALSLDPDLHSSTRLLGIIYHLKGDFLAAENTYRKNLQKSDPVSQIDARYWLGHLYLMQGKFEKCKFEIIEGINLSREAGLKEDESYLLLFLAYLNLQLRNFSEALEAANQSLKIAVETILAGTQKLALHFRGLIYLNMMEWNEAINTAEELNQLIEETGQLKRRRHYYHLIGMIDQAKNLISQSIDNFKNAISLLPHQMYGYDEHAFYIESLASAFYKSGDLEKSREEYEKIIALIPGRASYGDIYAKSFYMLGKIYERKGWKGKAIENYEKFLDLWKDADPGILEFVDARKRLAALKNQ